MDVRFLVDINVARLALWLRAMGYDAVFDRELDDNGLVERAMAEGRRLLTRDRRIMHRRVAASGQLQATLVRSDDLWEQLRQLVLELGLHTKGAFTRCLRCNTPLEETTKEAIRGLLPPYVYKTQEAFSRCPSCRRIYWRGTHWRNMLAEFERVGAEVGH